MTGVKVYGCLMLLLITISHFHSYEASLIAPSLVTNTAAPVAAQAQVEPSTLPPVVTTTIVILPSTLPTIVTTTLPVIPSTTLPIISETDRRYRLVFNNLYNTDIQPHISPLTTIPQSWTFTILNQISTYFGLTVNRFKDLQVIPNAEGRTVVEFRLTAGDTIYNSIQEMHKTFEANKATVQISISLDFQRVVLLKPLTTSCHWDVGSDPYDASCNLKPDNSRNLLALIVIPIAIILILIILALLWFFKFKPREKSSVTLNEMGYVENVSKFGGTVSKNNNTISGLSMANSTVRNQVYTTMGKNYGFSVENADFSDQNLEDVNLN